MRTTDFILFGMLGLAIYGVVDPAAASDLLANMGHQLRAILP